MATTTEPPRQPQQQPPAAPFCSPRRPPPSPRRHQPEPTALAPQSNPQITSQTPSQSPYHPLAAPDCSPPPPPGATVDSDLLAIALLSAEARRRGGLMMRERVFVGIRGRQASPLLLSRVKLLEKDVRGIVRTIAKTRRRVTAAHLAARVSAPATPAPMGR